MPEEGKSLAERIEQLEEVALYLSDLANSVHEHRSMLYRLADNAKAEAEKLRSQLAADAHDRFGAN